MEKKVSKLTFIRYTHVADNSFKQDVPLDVIFANHHPYKTAEITIRSGAEIELNQFVRLYVRDYGASISTGPWLEKFKNLTIFFNGSKFTGNDFGECHKLNETDVIEISLLDPEKNTLTHDLIVITKIQYTSNPG